MNDDRDPIIDACLEEVLGGERPPDICARILDAWSRQVPSATSQPPLPSLVDSVLPPVCAPQSNTSIRPVGTAVQPVTTRLSSGLRDRRLPVGWPGISIALGVLCLVTAGVVAYRASKSEIADSQGRAVSPRIAPPAHQAMPSSKPPAANSIAVRSGTAPAAGSGQRPNAEPDTTPVVKPVTGDRAVEHQPELPSFADQRPLIANQLTAAGESVAAVADGEIVERVNQAMRERWSRVHRQMPDPIDGDAWRQRVFRALVGRPPSNAEKDQYRELKSLGQREKLVRELLDSDKYREEFARHWGTILTGTFLPTELVEGNPRAVPDGMSQYFRRALLEGRSYDRIGQDLITATGSGLPGQADYNGAANFLLARAEGKFERAAADAARLLLGQAIDCQQCHDDFANPRRRQQDFWEWNAFFRQIAVIRDQETQILKLTDRDFLGDDDQDRSSAVVFYEQPDGVLKGAFPKLTGQLDFPHSGMLSVVNRRKLLAERLVTLPAFRLTMTNRVWNAVLGQSLVPMDDLDRATAESSVLLGFLADQFQAHDYDLRSVIGWTVLSSPFAVPAAVPARLNLVSSEGLFEYYLGDRVASGEPVHELLLASLTRLEAEPASALTARLSQTPGGRKANILDPTTLVNDRESIASDLLIGPSNPAPVADPGGQIRRFLVNPRLTTSQKTAHLFQFYLRRPPRRVELEVVERFHKKYADRTDSAWSAIQSVLQITAAGQGGLAR